MDRISFDKLLLKTAFCCMAADGNIDDREIAIIKSMCQKNTLFDNFNFQDEINLLVVKINNGGKVFIRYYLDLLKHAQLNEHEELTLIDFAIQTINADEQVEYIEIKFFKNIRHRLKVSDEKILEHFPDIEQFLEADIINEGFLDTITTQLLDIVILPSFDFIKVDSITPDS